MKPASEIVACVVDYGTFLCLADKLAETYAKVYYHSPIEKEYRCIEDALIGYGWPNIHKIESFMDLDIIKECDLFIFPDIGYGSEQHLLRDHFIKSVWGSMGADVLERLRTRFLSTVESLGLPVAPSKKIKGLDALSEYLKDQTDVWVKVNEFRDDQETFHHTDYQHTLPILRRLYVKFGHASNLVWFVVQKSLNGATEIGYDGWSVDGKFPTSSFQGYEKKNELYLGAATDYEALPEEVRLVNEKFAPVLREFGYRNFFATEIRNFEGTPYFIDPTLRMPGQTGEQLLETLENLADVIWQGANGELIEPEWRSGFAAAATMHSDGGSEDEKVVRVAKDALQNVKLCRCMYDKEEDVWCYPPCRNDEVGVVVGHDDTIEGAIAAVQDNFDAIGDDSLSIRFDGFVDLLNQIHQAEEEGIQFTPKDVPEPSSVIEQAS